MHHKVCTSIVLLALFFTFTESKYVKNTAKGNDFLFMSKFCYTMVPEEPETASGTLKIQINNPPNNVMIAIYNDGSNSWPSIYDQSTPCVDKIKYASANHSALVQNIQENPRDVINPHFWYIAAINCGGSIDLDYEITFLNSWGNDKWILEFSCDEIGLQGLYIFYFVFYVLFGLVLGYAVYQLIGTDSFHSIVKLLVITVAAEFLSVFCLFIHYTIYQHNGVGAPALRGIGDMLNLMDQLTFILLLILIAKGWTITKLKLEDGKVVIIGLALLSASYLALFIWENVGVDPASTMYIYQSAPGIIILVIRGLAMLWFVWCLRATYVEENHPAKRRFYVWFGGIYVAWFLMLPLITIIAASFKHPWYELKTVMIMYVTTNAVGYAGLTYLLWPSRANEYFQISARLDLAGTIPYDSI